MAFSPGFFKLDVLSVETITGDEYWEQVLEKEEDQGWNDENSAIYGDYNSNDEIRNVLSDEYQDDGPRFRAWDWNEARLSPIRQASYRTWPIQNGLPKEVVSHPP